VRHTFYDAYYTETGDPRTPWREFPNPSSRNCVGGLTGYRARIGTSQLRGPGMQRVGLSGARSLRKR
jgi:hypothetical protein